MGTAVAKRTATAVTLKPIAEVLGKIRGHLLDANKAEARCVKHRVAVGQLLLQLRQRVEAGEEGEIGWWEWFDKNAEYGNLWTLNKRKDCERLMRIASAENPEQALEDDNAKARERMRKLRGANVRSKPEEPRLRITEDGKTRYATKAERDEWTQATVQYWKDTWLRCHPGRTGEEYDEAWEAQRDDSQSPMWRWRRAMGGASVDAEHAAFQDHLGQELSEHQCQWSDEQ